MLSFLHNNGPDYIEDSTVGYNNALQIWSELSYPPLPIRI